MTAALSHLLSSTQQQQREQHAQDIDDTAVAAAAAATASAGLPPAPYSAAVAPAASVRLTDLLQPFWHAPGVTKTYSAWLSTCWGLTQQQQPATTLEAALLLLLALCQAGSWSAAAVLYASDVSAVLEQLCGFVRGSQTGHGGGLQLHDVLQRVYR